jgi:hypothetical protein
MEILLMLLGVMLGTLVSWGFHKKASQDQNTLFNKLPAEVREAMLIDKREKLSVSELNELIREKTIDGHAGKALPYIACPKCGSQDLQRTQDVEVEYGPEGPESASPYDIVRCKECGWEKTSHGYESSRDDIIERHPKESFGFVVRSNCLDCQECVGQIGDRSVNYEQSE